MIMGKKHELGRNLSREVWQETFKVDNNRRIGVFGLAEGVGATFLSLSLAWNLSRLKENSVGFVDAAGYLNEKLMGMPKARVYDLLGMDKRFSLRSYQDIFDMLERNENIREVFNIDEHINWAVFDPEGALNEAKKESNSEEDIGRYYGFIERLQSDLKCNLCVTDYGAYGNAYYLEKIIQELDEVIVVTDCHPSKLMAGMERLSEFKRITEEKGVHITYVVNRKNQGAPTYEIMDFLGVRKIFWISAIFEEDICFAEFNCKIPLAYKNIREEIGEEIQAIAKAISS